MFHYLILFFSNKIDISIEGVDSLGFFPCILPRNGHIGKVVSSWREDSAISCQDIVVSIFFCCKSYGCFSWWIWYHLRNRSISYIVSNNPTFSYQSKLFIFLKYSQWGNIVRIKFYNWSILAHVYNLNIIYFFFHGFYLTQEVLCITQVLFFVSKIKKNSFCFFDI